MPKLPPWPSPRESASAAERREAFNRQGLYAQALAGDISTTVYYDRAPSDESGEPQGTRSQLVYYYDNDQLLAFVHQYVRPDGSLGGHGRPDPKIVVTEDGRTLSE